MHKPPAASLCALAALLAGGCISPENDRLVIDQGVRLEAFDPVAPSAALNTTPSAPLELQQPSVLGVDRGNWAKSQLFVPVDATAHNPPYTKRWVLTDRTARQRREYPTALSALETTGASESEQQLEAPANWLAAFGDIVLLPIRVFWQAPWTTRWSPDEAYARYWHPESTGPVGTQAPPPAPFAEPAPTPVTP
jgi:hypothetical protein